MDAVLDIRYGLKSRHNTSRRSEKCHLRLLGAHLGSRPASGLLSSWPSGATKGRGARYPVVGDLRSVRYTTPVLSQGTESAGHACYRAEPATQSVRLEHAVVVGFSDLAAISATGIVGPTDSMPGRRGQARDLPFKILDGFRAAGGDGRVVIIALPAEPGSIWRWNSPTPDWIAAEARACAASRPGVWRRAWCGRRSTPE
jgi:hypothetical protein